MELLWGFIAGIDSEEQFTVATNISSETSNFTTTVSCRGRCMEASSRPSLLECKCDKACMFLGDCCCDYLMECDSRDIDLNTALHEQLSTFQRFELFTTCVDLWYEKAERATKLVDFCPTAPVPHGLHSELAVLCEANINPSMSTSVPVEHNGVLFQNMYCAACHGLPFHQINQVIDYNVECSNVDENEVKFRWLPFVKGCKIKFTSVSMKPFFEAIWHRYQEVCHCPSLEKLCFGRYFENKCIASLNTSHIPYHSKACRDCLCQRSVYWQHRPNVFVNFTGKQLTNKNIPDTLSMAKTCQDGFSIHDDICMSQATSQACYSPKENRHLTDYHVANLFKSALIIHFQWPNVKYDISQHKIWRKSHSCTILPHLYATILPKRLSTPNECAIFYIDPMAFSDISQAIEIWWQTSSLTLRCCTQYCSTMTPYQIFPVPAKPDSNLWLPNRM